jgi:hypothetical protein
VPRNISSRLSKNGLQRKHNTAQTGQVNPLVFPDFNCVHGCLSTLAQNDLISWLLEYAQGHQRTVRDLTIRVLQVNFAAIHTTSMVGDFSILVTYVSHVVGFHPRVI